MDFLACMKGYAGMASYNRIVLVGNLTRDPEHKQLTSGQGVCRLGLATNRQFKNRQTGELVQEVCYVDIDVWGAQADSCNQYLSKGRGVLIEGRLKFDTWEDQNGQTRSKHSVVADRVVFLAASAQADQDAIATTRDDQTSSTPAPKAFKAEAVQEPQSQLEKDIAGQVEQVKKRVEKKQAQAAKKTSSEDKEGESTSTGGEIDFKDQPPFEDDLPF